jgi:hypothetical protein
MKRFLLFVLVGIVVVLLVLFALRRRPGPARSAAAGLLPSDTALFFQIPNAEKNREDWHRTEFYALYREPAVQAFLQKPKAQLQERSALINGWHEAGKLRMRDTFVATNSFDALRLVGGFEFRCSEKEAITVIEGWKLRLLGKAGNAQRSTNDYEKHRIDVITGEVTLASTIVGNRFLVATNINDLMAILDRIDGRVKTLALESDQNFREAMKEMPADCAWVFYLQPKQLAQKLAALRTQDGRALPPSEQTMLERVRSFSHATVFDGQKIREVDFAAMPRMFDAKLTRDTLSIASPDTFLYLATIINLQQLDWNQMFGHAAAGPAAGQIQALAQAGITPDDWRAAFGDEVSLIADWPASAQIPGLVATLTVRDSSRAKRIVSALAASAGWQSTVRDNVQYFTAPMGGSALAISPTVAVSDRLLVIGGDSARVDRAMAPPKNGSGLDRSPNFRSAAKLVPSPQQMFTYLDLGALYSRLDATLRPLLQMSAAFVPSMTEHVDPAKLPPAEVVTRHLSPVVAAQSYTGNGYRSESVGPITIGQTAGVAAAAWVGTLVLKNKTGVILASPAATSSATPSTPLSSPVPTP